MVKVTLSDENRKILSKLQSDFRHSSISANNFNRDVVNLIAEMVVEAMQLSQDNEKSED